MNRVGPPGSRVPGGSGFRGDDVLPPFPPRPSARGAATSPTHCRGPPRSRLWGQYGLRERCPVKRLSAKRGATLSGPTDACSLRCSPRACPWRPGTAWGDRVLWWVKKRRSAHEAWRAGPRPTTPPTRDHHTARWQSDGQTGRRRRTDGVAPPASAGGWGGGSSWGSAEQHAPIRVPRVS